MPRLAVAVLLLALVALASTMSYVGYLIIGVIAGHLGTSRLLAGLLLGVLFARLPSVRDGKLRTIGLLPKWARLPVMVALLAFCLLSFSYRGEWVPVMFLGFATAFLLIYPQIKKRIAHRLMSFFSKSPTGQNPPQSTVDTVIDVEFREKKD
jgi:hypothetical protein